MRHLLITAALVSASLTTACAPLATPVATSPGPSAMQGATAFMEAFNGLDQSKFDAFFAPDATMFFPDGPFPQARVEGKEAVTAAFRQAFDMARKNGATRLNITPLDMQVQDYGDLAIATFHLKGNGNIGRRSIIMRREQAGWQIVHFHASALKEKQ